jgi:hypothetical protein
MAVKNFSFIALGKRNDFQAYSSNLRIRGKGGLMPKIKRTYAAPISKMPRGDE